MGEKSLSTCCPGYEKVSKEDIGIEDRTYLWERRGDAIHLLQITDSDMEESLTRKAHREEICICRRLPGYYLDSGRTHVLIWEKNGCT